MVLALVDDDGIWIKRAKSILQECADRLSITLELLCFQSGRELLSYTEKPVNAAFIDIELEEENGIKLASTINIQWPECQIVYCTDYMYYAMDVYGTKHSHFLTKARMEDCIDAVVKKLYRIWCMENELLSFHVIKAGKTTFRVKDILYFERKTRQTTLVTTRGKYNLSEKITEITDSLPEGEFTRCHASFTVNLSCIARKNGNSYELVTGESIPISKSFSDMTRRDYLSWCAEQIE